MAVCLDLPGGKAVVVGRFLTLIAVIVALPSFVAAAERARSVQPQGTEWANFFYQDNGGPPADTDEPTAEPDEPGTIALPPAIAEPETEAAEDPEEKPTEEEPAQKPAEEEESPEAKSAERGREEIAPGERSEAAADEGELGPELGHPRPGDDFDGPPPKPAPTCSSGTWLNRGGWFSQIDFSYLSRMGPNDFVLARSPTDQFVQLASDESLGFEPGMRLTLGRFLCRDGKNRDHTLELTFFGLHDWFDEKGITIANNSLATNFVQNLNEPNVRGFVDTQSQRYTYRSELDSLELNWRISRRLGRDQMELRRNGCWVRKCTPHHLASFIAGVRTASMDESFGYFADSSVPAIRRGSYTIQTENDLLGMQLGGEFFLQHCKWKTGVRVKGGPYINWSQQASQVARIDTPANLNTLATRDEQAETSGLAFLGEVQLSASYNFRPNMALRVSSDLMWANQVALGPDQINFAVRNPPEVVDGGALFFSGGSIGLEFYW